MHSSETEIQTRMIVYKPLAYYPTTEFALSLDYLTNSSCPYLIIRWYQSTNRRQLPKWYYRGSALPHQWNSSHMDWAGCQWQFRFLWDLSDSDVRVFLCEWHRHCCHLHLQGCSWQWSSLCIYRQSDPTKWVVIYVSLPFLPHWQL